MDGKGRVYDLVYDRIESPQRVECHLAANLIESGTCKLILTTYAGDESEDARLGIYERVVSFVKFEEEPTIACFSTRPTGDEDHAYDLATKSYIRGNHLGLGVDDTVTVERMRPGETEWSRVEGVTVNAAESTENQIVLDYADTIGGIETKLRATVKIGSKTANSNEIVVSDEY